MKFIKNLCDNYKMISQFNLKKITQIVNKNGVIAYPSESVFGLGCDPLNELAVQKILTIKQRSVEKGLILIGNSVSQLKPWVQKMDDKVWNGIVQISKTTPINWLMPKSSLVPKWITGEHSQVVIRLSRHPVINQICNALSYPIVSTSANFSGCMPLNHSIKVQKQLGCYLDLIVFGHSGGLAPCPIIDMSSGTILRK